MPTVTTLVDMFSPTEWAYIALFLAVPVLVAVAGWLASRRAPEEMVSRQIRQTREAGGVR